MEFLHGPKTTEVRRRCPALLYELGVVLARQGTVLVRFLLRQPDAGLGVPRKLVESSWPELLDHPQRRRGELDQRRNVNPLACRRERLEICRPAGQHVDDSVIIAPLKM